MTVGDTFTLLDGRRVAVVNRWQKRQVLAWWVHGLAHEDLEDIIRNDELEMWNVRDHHPRLIANGCLSLCLVSELDEPDANEWGLIMP